MALPPHIKRADDLVTSAEATSWGFMEQAREKVSLAAPHVRDALRFRRAVDTTSVPAQLAREKSIRAELLASVGLSEKAISHILPADLERILKDVLEGLHRRAGDLWKEELVIRFSLTRGDSLGGSSRNLAGAKAKDQFADAVVQALRERSETPRVQDSKGGTRKVERIAWDDRLIIFDRKPDIVGKNIDVIMIDDDHSSSVRPLLERKGSYVACGEVKGGIDPAGADEHWKTAKSALDRIRSSFGLKRPALFFAGAAIEKSMAEEIVSQLRTDQLNFAANLTKPQQVADLVEWLIAL